MPSEQDSTDTIRLVKSVVAQESEADRVFAQKQRDFITRYNDVVVLQVGNGSNKQTFLVHKGLLRSVSPFFSAAFSGGFLENLDDFITLPEDGASTVAYFLMWLYKVEVECPPSMVIAAYEFADKIQCITFKNSIIRTLNDTIYTVTVDRQKKVSKEGVLWFGQLWRLSGKESGVRRLIIDTFLHLPLHSKEIDLLSATEDQMPRELLAHLTIGALDAKKRIPLQTYQKRPRDGTYEDDELSSKGIKRARDDIYDDAKQFSRKTKVACVAIPKPPRNQKFMAKHS